MRLPRLHAEAVMALFGVLLLVGGCNVFGFTSPSPNSVDALLTDARLALDAGNSSRAVRLLERAFKKDSTDVRVRVELGTALFDDRGVDVFTLEKGGRHLVGPPDSGPTTDRPETSGRRTKPVCTNGFQPEESPDRFETIPLDAPPVRVLVEHRTVVNRVQKLVVEGVLRHRRQAFSEAGVDLRQKGLLVGAVALTVRQVIHLHDSFVEAESTLYYDRGRQSERSLLACARSEDLLRQNNRALCTLSTAAGQALEWLRRRSRLLGGDQNPVLSGPLRNLSAAAGARANCSSVAVGGPF